MLNEREGGGGSSIVEMRMVCWFTGRDDGRDQIAIRKCFNRRLPRIERCAVNVIAGAANIVSAHVRSRSESVTRWRVRAHVASVTRITALQMRSQLRLVPAVATWHTNSPAASIRILSPVLSRIIDSISIRWDLRLACVTPPHVLNSLLTWSDPIIIFSFPILPPSLPLHPSAHFKSSNKYQPSTHRVHSTLSILDVGSAWHWSHRRVLRNHTRDNYITGPRIPLIT